MHLKLKLEGKLLVKEKGWGTSILSVQKKHERWYGRLIKNGPDFPFVYMPTFCNVALQLLPSSSEIYFQLIDSGITLWLPLASRMQQKSSYVSFMARYQEVLSVSAFSLTLFFLSFNSPTTMRMNQDLPTWGETLCGGEPDKARSSPHLAC